MDSPIYKLKFSSKNPAKNDWNELQNNTAFHRLNINSMKQNNTKVMSTDFNIKSLFSTKFYNPFFFPNVLVHLSAKFLLCEYAWLL